MEKITLVSYLIYLNMKRKNNSKFKEKGISLCQRSASIEVAPRWLGNGKAKAQGKGIGRGAIACHHRHVSFLEFTCVFRFFVLTSTVASREIETGK